MLIEFSVKNYRSFRDEAVLSMEATKSSTLKSVLIPFGGMQILPSAVIYGKNGGGKSNIKQFMTSALAKELDSTYNRMQWAGEEYLLEEFADRCPNAPKGGNLYHNEVLYWAGYVYRYWHFLTVESSKDIYKQAPAETMNTNYLMFHCMDTELAIEDLKEIHRQKAKKRSKSGRKAMPDRIQSD